MRRLAQIFFKTTPLELDLTEGGFSNPPNNGNGGPASRRGRPAFMDYGVAGRNVGEACLAPTNRRVGKPALR